MPTSKVGADKPDPKKGNKAEPTTKATPPRGYKGGRSKKG